MTTNTPTFGLPKPELTDLVTNGWDAIADLADAMDAQLAAVRAALQAADAAEAAARGNGDAARIALAVIDAAGDLLVGSGPDAVARLPKGAEGNQLVINGGNVAWAAPPATDLSSRVAKAGDTMTGRLQVPDLGVSVGTTLNLRQQGTATRAHLDAGNVLDNGNRVYSASNPPPAGGTVLNKIVKGSIAMAGGVTSATATIAAVVLAKSELRNLGTSSATTQAGDGFARVDLTNTTTVTATRAVGGQASTTQFELTEWT